MASGTSVVFSDVAAIRKEGCRVKYGRSLFRTRNTSHAEWTAGRFSGLDFVVNACIAQQQHAPQPKRGTTTLAQARPAGFSGMQWALVPCRCGCGGCGASRAPGAAAWLNLGESGGCISSCTTVHDKVVVRCGERNVHGMVLGACWLRWLHLLVWWCMVYKWPR